MTACSGAFALVIMFAERVGLLIGARSGSPLAVGYGENEMFLGSDALSLAPFTNRITYLEEGDIAVVTGASVGRSSTQQRVNRRASRSDGAFRHA